MPPEITPSPTVPDNLRSALELACRMYDNAPREFGYPVASSILSYTNNEISCRIDHAGADHPATAVAQLAHQLLASLFALAAAKAGGA